MKALIIYFTIINFWEFVFMGLDKAYARRGEYRIPEKTSFWVALLGGAAGGTAGMFFFRHKTRHWYFRYGFPAIALLHIALFIIV